MIVPCIDIGVMNTAYLQSNVPMPVDIMRSFYLHIIEMHVYRVLFEAVRVFGLIIILPLCLSIPLKYLIIKQKFAKMLLYINFVIYVFMLLHFELSSFRHVSMLTGICNSACRRI